MADLIKSREVLEHGYSDEELAYLQQLEDYGVGDPVDFLASHTPCEQKTVYDFLRRHGNFPKGKSEGLTIKVNVDVSDALTAIKAVERKAREAKRAVAESVSVGEAAVPLNGDTLSFKHSKVGEYSYTEISRDLSEVVTDDLVTELARREGVDVGQMDGGIADSIRTGDGWRFALKGPSKIIVIAEEEGAE